MAKIDANTDYVNLGFLLPAISIFIVGQLTFEWRYVAVFLLALSQAGSEIAIMGGFLLSNIDLAPQYTGVLQVHKRKQ